MWKMLVDRESEVRRVYVNSVCDWNVNEGEISPGHSKLDVEDVQEMPIKADLYTSR